MMTREMATFLRDALNLAHQPIEEVAHQRLSPLAKRRTRIDLILVREAGEIGFLPS